MPDLGKKYTCYSCHTKFYDLGKPVPICPKCGADQRDADEAPVGARIAQPCARGRRAVARVEEASDEEFGAEGEVAPPAGDEDEEIIPEADRDEEPADEEEDEDY